ncbi:MAG TPA: hypothetical protein VNA68_00665 [Candidatus Dormibacteraeota bacterium]|nr:hypothetical protein [Candidatus Dormibacteraeota bacterium]
MKLRDMEFGNVFCAPGARGFGGEGYPFHKAARLLGMTWKGTTFVAKTMTMRACIGNLPLKGDGMTPKEKRPRSVVVKPFSGHVLNAAGLSNPGAAWLFSRAGWNNLTEPFVLSFMAAEETPEARMNELNQFVTVFEHYLYALSDFQAPVALQLNFGCPNMSFRADALLDEIREMLELASGLSIPLIANFSPVTPEQVVAQTASHPACDALWIANTVPWGYPEIDWQRIFGTEASPLREQGFEQSGGLSGPACLPLTAALVKKAREYGISKPIVAGNGIQRAEDVLLLKDVGADAIALGIVGMVRPWRMRGIIRTANEVLA